MSDQDNNPVGTTSSSERSTLTLESWGNKGPPPWAGGYDTPDDKIGDGKLAHVEPTPANANKVSELWEEVQRSSEERRGRPRPQPDPTDDGDDGDGDKVDGDKNEDDGDDGDKEDDEKETSEGVK
jgi:hypothetical protein